jgi:outer membrane lipoprotein SlyB
MKTIVVFAASLVIATGGIASTAGAVGCVSGAVVGGVAGHYATTGPNHKHHTMAGAAAGCVAGHMMAEHNKKVAHERAAAAHAGAPHH